LQGPLSSPKALSDDGPVQHRLVDEQDRTYGINPVLAEPAYLKPEVREACKVAALRSVQDAAADVRDGAPLDTTAVQREFTQDVRAWLTHAPDQKPELKTLLDNFVHRDDHRLVRQVDKALHESGLSSEQQTEVWQSFEVASTMQEKQSVLGMAQTMTQQAKGSGASRPSVATDQAAKTERTEHKGFQVG
jgi:hypothetical protein